MGNLWNVKIQIQRLPAQDVANGGTVQLCPSVMDFYTSEAQTNAMERSTEATHRYSLCSQLYLLALKHLHYVIVESIVVVHAHVSYMIFFSGFGCFPSTVGFLALKLFLIVFIILFSSFLSILTQSFASSQR